VHKFEFNIFPNVNGVYMKNSRYFWQASDQLEIDYNFMYHGQAVFEDYMDFLNQSYYHDTPTVDIKYSGNWVDS
jgi:hypothetical protein